MPRPQASGSVYQRKDGFWCAAIPVMGRRVVRYAHTQRAARLQLGEMVKDYRLGRLAPPTRMTLSDWVERWLEQSAPTIRSSTLRTYRDTLSPVVAAVGSIRLDRLTPSLLADMFATFQSQGRGARRLCLAHGYLRACLDRAVDLDVIAVNPMTKVTKPRWQPRERRYWSVDEASRFVDTALSSGTKWAPLFVLLSTCGLRISEALGLRWSDIDLKARQLRIERACPAPS